MRKYDSVSNNFYDRVNFTDLSDAKHHTEIVTKTSFKELLVNIISNATRLIKITEGDNEKLSLFIDYTTKHSKSFPPVSFLIFSQRLQFVNDSLSFIRIRKLLRFERSTLVVCLAGVINIVVIMQPAQNFN